MMIVLIVLVMLTWIVSNEFRTDPKFSSVSPLDNFSQIIFAPAHSFIIVEKYHHLDEFHCHRSHYMNLPKFGEEKDWIYFEHSHHLVLCITHPSHQCNVTMLSIRKSLLGK